MSSKHSSDRTPEGFYEATTKTVSTSTLLALRQKHKASNVEKELREFRVEIGQKFQTNSMTKGFVFPRTIPDDKPKRLKKLEKQQVPEGELTAVLEADKSVAEEVSWEINTMLVGVDSPKI